jgi:peptide-methionine (S)-S-oxide reductase
VNRELVCARPNIERKLIEAKRIKQVKERRFTAMKSPIIGRALAFLVILGCVAWWGARVMSGHPAEPKGAFPSAAFDTTLARQPGKETAVFAGGCFWGVQGVFQHVKGVTSATSGYAGGTVENPYYELVSSGSTGHAESVKVVYDPSQITYGKLLKIFFSVAHDPTQKDRQGPDIGTQYRSAVFYTSEEQRKIAEAYIAQIDAAKIYDRKIATQAAPLAAFYEAEDYHQDFLRKHPDNAYIQFNDLPKIERLKKSYPQQYR